MRPGRRRAAGVGFQPAIWMLGSAVREMSTGASGPLITRTTGRSRASSRDAHDDGAAAVGEVDFDARGERRDPSGEHVGDRRVELRAGAGEDRLDADVGGLGRRVHALGGDRVVDVGDGGDPSHLVDLGAALALGIAGAVPALVVAQDAGLDQRAPGARVANQLHARLGVGLDDLPLLLGQLAGLVQDRFGDRELADVGQQQPHPEAEQPLLVAVVLALALVVEPPVLDDQPRARSAARGR